MANKEQSPVDRTIASKTKLVARLEKEIGNVRANAEAEVKAIQFRIRMAQTLLDALKKGR